MRSPLTDPHRRPRHLIAGAFLLTVVVFTAGCSSQTTSGTGTSAPTAPTAPTSAEASPTAATTSPSGSAGAECTSTVSATTKNPALLAAAKQLFTTMDCASSTSLGAQLSAAYEDPDFQAQAKAAGWSTGLNRVDAGGGTTAVALVDLKTQSSCQVQAITDPRTKGLLCGDA